VTLAFRDLFSSDGVVNRHPLSDYTEIRLNFQKLLQNERLGLADGIFNCQHADIVIADAEMVAFSLDVGICDLIVKNLSALGTAFDPAGLVVQEASQEVKSILPATVCRSEQSRKPAGRICERAVLA